MNEVHPQELPPSILVQLLKLSTDNRGAIVAACDGERRYTHLFNPHPSFDPDDTIGKRDEEVVPAYRVVELVRLKSDVLSTGRATHRRIRINVEGEDRFYEVVAEPIIGGGGKLWGVATAAIDVTPSQELRLFLQDLAKRLQREGDRIAEVWHAELQRRMRVRPEYVFPGDDLLDGVPSLLQWLADQIDAPTEIGGKDTAAVREIAGRWRSAGYTVEETLVHLRILGDLLFDSLEQATAEAGKEFSPTVGVHAARRLARALELVEVLIVAAYRDHEEGRYARFAAMLAHEVRDQLHTALINLQLLEFLDSSEEADPASKRQAMARAEHGLRQANKIVIAVRALSRASGAGDRQWERKPLRTIISDVVGEHRDRLPARVTLEVGEVPACAVPAAPVHMILHNLVENAIKYADPEADAAWVRIGCEQAPTGSLTLQVADNGVGIPEEDRERIFLRFHRGQDKRGEGFGLGLAIVKESTDQIGARVLVESQPGRGSTFSLVIPAEHVRE